MMGTSLRDLFGTKLSPNASEQSALLPPSTLFQTDKGKTGDFYVENPEENKKEKREMSKTESRRKHNWKNLQERDGNHPLPKHYLSPASRPSAKQHSPRTAKHPLRRASPLRRHYTTLVAFATLVKGFTSPNAFPTPIGRRPKREHQVAESCVVSRVPSTSAR